MIILRKYKGDINEEWFEVSKEEFLDDTEGGGAWKEGTALETLEEFGKLWTNFCLYKQGNKND